MSELIGKSIGRYQILEQIGKGGMATVYKAYDTRLERDVAVKVIRREAFLPEDMEMLLKRFDREAKLLAGLSHPNIVGVMDFGEFEGAPYLVMEYLPGGTLKDRLGSPMPWRDAIKLLLPIANALEYVHDRNYINRDIKPSNVLMTEKGQPMLTDFGLLKVFGDKDKDATSLTATGVGIGTPDYMAPEQWTGEATALSDMYSLGVVLYEMITGRRPYVADTPAAILIKQANEPLPLPKSYIPDLPSDVEAVLLKTLAKDPAHRYPDVKTFIRELQNLLEGKQTTASTIGTQKLRQQMTGRYPKAKKTAAGQAGRKWVVPVLIIAVIGMIGVVAVSGGYWYLSSNSVGPAPALTSTQQILASPTLTAPDPTEAPPTESAPTEVPPVETAPPTEAALPPEIRDDKNVKMILIPAGEFTMGSDNSGDVSTIPGHTVYVEAFYMDQFEVTNEMYDACSYAIECIKPRQTNSATRNPYFSNPVFANFPVIHINWKMAKAYCEWRGARLPTEAEWEKAARGTDERIYPWGTDDPDCGLANFAGCIGDTAEVDQYETGLSPYGLYGMAGNVWEWTSTLASNYPYDATDGREDPDKAGKRIARGGSWNPSVNSGNISTVTRFEVDPGHYGPYVGLRCVRSAEQNQEIQ